MPEPHVDDRVRLKRDIPDLSLHCGDVGVVRSVWFAPSCAYEVEFEATESEFRARALLGDEQIELEEQSAVACGA